MPGCGLPRQAPPRALELASDCRANSMKDFGIWTFASRSGFVIRCPRERLFRLFLGSSAVEHSTVNRMVVGSNPARGANFLQQNQTDTRRARNGPEPRTAQG